VKSRCSTKDGVKTEFLNPYTRAFVGEYCFRQAQATLAELVEAIVAEPVKVLVSN
jgi:hypothetical protein